MPQQHWTDHYTDEQLAEMGMYANGPSRDALADAADPREDGVPDLSTFQPCMCDWDTGTWFPCAKHMTPHSEHVAWDRVPGCGRCEAEGFTYLGEER